MAKPIRSASPAGGHAQSRAWTPAAPGRPARHAFEGLVRENAGWLQGWLRGRVDDPELVHDISQEAFLKTFRGWSQLKDPQRFSGWLFRTAQNLLRDQLRQRRRRRTRTYSNEDLDTLPDTTDAPDRVERDEEAVNLLEAVRALPEKYREPLLLRHSEGLSYEEIGNILGIRSSAVRVRMHRARQMLREKFDRVTP